MSCASVVDVAARSVGTHTPSKETAITRLRASRSASAPNTGADRATPSVAADTVMPTPVFEAWNRRARSGRSGWVQYSSRKAHTPQRATAAAASLLGTGWSVWEWGSNVLG